jgi:hypothetical protein
MKCFDYGGVWTLVDKMPTTLEKSLKDSKRSNANVVNTSHFDLNYALHPEHPNATGSSTASKIERN